MGAQGDRGLAERLAALGHGALRGHVEGDAVATALLARPLDLAQRSAPRPLEHQPGDPPLARRTFGDAAFRRGADLTRFLVQDRPLSLQRPRRATRQRS